MKNNIFLGLMILMFLTSSCGFSESAGETKAVGDTSWTSFNTGIERAEQANKPVLIDFYADWCHWCKVMDKETFSNAEVAKYLQDNFITIKLDAENRKNSLSFQGRQYSSAELTRAFKVTGFPSIAFLDKNQKPVTVIPGFVKPETFIHILKYVKDECYKKNVTLDEFIKNGCNKT